MFKMEVKTGGAAFRDECSTDGNGNYALDPFGVEISDILRDVANLIRNCEIEGVIMDSNGNKVGHWSYE